MKKTFHDLDLSSLMIAELTMKRELYGNRLEISSRKAPRSIPTKRRLAVKCTEYAKRILRDETRGAEALKRCLTGITALPCNWM